MNLILRACEAYTDENKKATTREKKNDKKIETFREWKPSCCVVRCDVMKKVDCKIRQFRCDVYAFFPEDLRTKDEQNAHYVLYYFFMIAIYFDLTLFLSQRSLLFINFIMHVYVMPCFMPKTGLG